MTWLRIDDGMVDNPKIVSLPVATKWAYVEMLSHAARNLTDGHIPAIVGKRIATPKAITELVAAALLDTNGDGWIIHDYLDYNPTRAKVLAERAATAERVRKSREKRHTKTTPVTGGETA